MVSPKFIYETTQCLGAAAGRIELIAPHPDWKRFFRVEKARVEHCLPYHAGQMEHIGSTAVNAGLASEPILDLLLGFGGGGLPAVAAALATLGYQGLGDSQPGELEAEKFILCNNQQRITHCIYAAEFGGGFWRDSLAWKNKLEQSADLRAEFSRRKRELAESFRNDRIGYTRAKQQIFINLL